MPFSLLFRTERGDFQITFDLLPRRESCRLSRGRTWRRLCSERHFGLRDDWRRRIARHSLAGRQSGRRRENRLGRRRNRLAFRHDLALGKEKDDQSPDSAEDQTTQQCDQDDGADAG